MFKNVDSSFIHYVVNNTSDTCFMEARCRFILNEKIFKFKDNNFTNLRYDSLIIKMTEMKINIKIFNICEFVKNNKKNIKDYLNNKYDYCSLRCTNDINYWLCIDKYKFNICVDFMEGCREFDIDDIITFSTPVNNFIIKEFKKLLKEFLLIL